MPGWTSAERRLPRSSAFSRSRAATVRRPCASARRRCCRNCAAGLTDCRCLPAVCRRPPMKLNVAIQMDHVSTIDIDGDSTFVLALEAERRGYEVWHYTPPELIFRDRRVLARMQ